MPTLPKCSNPRGAKYCADPDCPARDKLGNHIVVASLGNDLDKSFSLNKKPAPKPKPETPTPQYVPPTMKPHETDVQLFDDNSEWVGSEIFFYNDAVGANPVFYCEPNEEYTVVAKLSWERKKDIYIISRGAMRVQYGTHVIRSSKQLISIGVNSDLKLAKAVNKNLLTILQEPKFEAVHIRYMGRKDETRTPVLPLTSDLSALIFSSIKYMQQ
jgi:hypothetical protein